MRTFFDPSSIAVVGASTRKGGKNIVGNLRYGFKGPIYPINPNYRELETLPCFPSLDDVPHAVDLAVVFVPAPVVPGVLESCARKSVRRVMIESAGFAEVGEEGRAIQDRCLAIAREAGIRIWGPNCMGLVDVVNKRFFTFMSPRIYQDALIPSRVSLIAQSGMLSAAFISDLMSNRRTGIGKVCSIGNKMDVDECDLLDYLMEDPETAVVALYLESMPRGRLFAEKVERAAKPVVLLKGGKSEAGARAAMSHTSSLSGNSRLFDSVMTGLNVKLADDFHQMIDLARALAVSRPLPPSFRTAILTFSGGSGILTCDLLEKYHLRPAHLSPQTAEGLKRLFPDWMPVNNPVDIWPAVEKNGRIAVYAQAVTLLLNDPNVDALFVHYVTGLEDDELDLPSMKAQANLKAKALFFWLIGRGEQVLAFRRSADECGIPCFGEISRAVECLVSTAAPRKTPVVEFRTDIRNESESPSGRESGDGELFPDREPMLDELAGKQLLARYGIPTVREQQVATPAEARGFAERTGFPVVLKGLLPGVSHKTELGLVKTGIFNDQGIERAFRTIEDRMGGQGRVVVQQQAKVEYELMAGFLRDDSFGPCVMLGMGGVLAELEPDVVFCLAPLTRESAAKLFGRLRNGRLLEGYRGIAPVNREVLAQVLVSLGDIGVNHPEIAQIDINPLVVADGLPLAVDALVVRTVEAEGVYNSKENG